jgi:hypothetical protein
VRAVTPDARLGKTGIKGEYRCLFRSSSSVGPRYRQNAAGMMGLARPSMYGKAAFATVSTNTVCALT